MTRAEMKAAAKLQIKGSIGIFFLIMLVTGLIAATYIGSLVVPAISVSVCAICINLTNGQKPSFGDMFCRIGTFGKSLWLSILIAFFTILWSMLFYIPGIVKAYSYSMAYYVLAENPELTARQALNISKQITKGHKGELFVLDLSFIGWCLLGVITFGLAFIYVAPYMDATRANFYNSIKNGAAVEA